MDYRAAITEPDQVVNIKVEFDYLIATSYDLNGSNELEEPDNDRKVVKNNIL